MIVVERIEEQLAVLEIFNESGIAARKTIRLSALPAAVSEGDVLIETSEGYAVDTVETQRRRLEAIARLRHLIKR